MPAGLPYFAWIDVDEIAFGPEHMRWDEQVFSFTLKQDEGDPASLTAVVRRPRNEAGDAIGLLGPGRAIWAWFALDCGSSNLFKFRGRLVGVPTSIFEERVTLEFVARPSDLVAQKEALAETLRVLPHYDEVVLDPPQRKDPEVVLEGYSKIWHYDRETHTLTVSDEILGEDGVVVFDGASADSRVLYDGLGLTLTSGPLARVDVKAEYTWTQTASGGPGVDLTGYLLRNWPGAVGGTISSYTLDAGSWPKIGASIGDGWVVTDADARDLVDLTVTSKTSGSTMKVVFPDTSWFGESEHTTTFTETVSEAHLGLGSIRYAGTIKDTISVKTASGETTAYGTSTYTSSYTRNYSETYSALALHSILPKLWVGYAANRPCKEQVSFSLYADVQHVLTDPKDGEALRINDIKSVNLSEKIGEGTDAYVPIGDPRRRSYIATERGNRSIEHLIALARAHLMKRARVVEIAFAPKLSRMPEVTLRKDAFLVEPRVGEAMGKIIGYSVAMDGSDGLIKCEVRIGCAIGYGGSVVAVEGTPNYATADYVGADYQQFEGRTVLLDTSVGYQPPLADPNDDGINFLSTVRAEDVIVTPLVVEHPWEEQGTHLVNLAKEEVSEVLSKVQTRATFKLTPMTGAFATVYEVPVTDLKIPTGYDLEVA